MLVNSVSSYLIYSNIYFLYMESKYSAFGCVLLARKNSQIITRKVQRLGASSLIVTIPKEWARKHGIRVGDPIVVYDEGDRLVITPSNSEPNVGLSFKLNKSNVARHMGRLSVCSYIFGFDYVSFENNRPLRGSLLNKLSEISDVIPGSKMSFLNDYEVQIYYPQDSFEVLSLLAQFGREIGAFLGRLSLALKTKDFKLIRSSDINDLTKLSLIVARSVIKSVSMNSTERRLMAGMQEIAGLLGTSISLIREIVEGLVKVASKLSDHEVERLSFVLELLEVATSALGSGIASPSVKKSEEAYFKLNSVIELDRSMDEILEDWSPYGAYIIGKIVDLAKLLEFVEQAVLCYSIIKKYSELEEENIP